MRTWGCPPRGPGSSSRTPRLDQDLGFSDLSHTMYWFNGSTKSTPPQNSQLNVLISLSQQQLDEFVSSAVPDHLLECHACRKENQIQTSFRMPRLDFTWKDNQITTFLAMKFTTRILQYYYSRTCCEVNFIASKVLIWFPFHTNPVRSRWWRGRGGESVSGGRGRRSHAAPLNDNLLWKGN